jgi:hypothetical protein
MKGADTAEARFWWAGRMSISGATMIAGMIGVVSEIEVRPAAELRIRVAAAEPRTAEAVVMAVVAAVADMLVAVAEATDTTKCHS